MQFIGIQLDEQLILIHRPVEQTRFDALVEGSKQHDSLAGHLIEGSRQEVEVSRQRDEVSKQGTKIVPVMRAMIGTMVLSSNTSPVGARARQRRGQARKLIIAAKEGFVGWVGQRHAYERGFTNTKL
jgi:hypothetical protein